MVELSVERSGWPIVARAALLALLAVVFAGCASRRAVASPRARSAAVHALKAPRALRGRWIRVRRDETLADVARRSGASLSDLEELNGIARDRVLAAASRVFVPTRRRPQRITRRSRQAPPPREPGQPSTKRHGGTTAASGAGDLLWPVAGGKLSSPFGRRRGRPHEGIDIAAAAGTPVRAAAAGRVIYSGSGIRGYGNLVIIRHAGKLLTVYAHNQRNLVQRGTRVRRGQIIAEVGHTGRATGNHLHFEVRRGEKPRDPLRYVKAP